MPASPETYLISSVLRGSDYTTAQAHGVTEEMFHAYGDEWVWISDYYARYRKTPTKGAFTRHFPEFRIKAVDDTLHFVDEVRSWHARHMLTGTLRDVADQIAKGDIDGAIAAMQGSMVVVANAIGGVSDTDILRDWKGVYEDVEYRRQRFEEFGMAGIPTGFETLDERTGGVSPGQSWVVGARLGEGKSWTLLRMATAAVMSGYRVQFDALEMSRPEVGMRVHNFLSGTVGKQVFQSLDLSQGHGFDPKAYREFLRGLGKTIEGQLFVSDSPSIGAVEMAAQIERNHPDILFLDYLTLGKTSGDGGWQDIGNFSKDLKRLARTYNVGVVSAAQLNRKDGLSKDVPGAEALGQSDAIGQDADAVINMKARSPRVVEMKLTKFRHGKSGYKWFCNLNLSAGSFSEISYNRAMDLIQEDREREANERESSR